ncbi:MAG: MBL fold metallo-hydrolase [Planctomycetota bacterium]|jgi:glyoxylase-like metal-dependent hydrolase (beta-lactamase superfamily II)
MNLKFRVPVLAVSIAATAPALAQVAEDVVVEATPIAGNVHMITGRGGNIGLCVGADGAFLIDDQFAPLTGQILATVAELTPEPVRFVVNTHWHFDHTGGNENLGEAGAIIVAHENVRNRLSTDQFMAAFNRTVPASPHGALPVITFTDSVTFHWNDDELRVIHVNPAHTDGDAIIHFRKANVIHMGDVYFNGMYPFIDASAGGRIAGMIKAIDRALELTDDRTRIIPGHGELSGVAELRAYRAMLRTVHDRVQKLIDEGKTRDEVIAAKPTRDLDAEWGSGFMQPDPWVGIVYDSMVVRN